MIRMQHLHQHLAHQGDQGLLGSRQDPADRADVETGPHSVISLCINTIDSTANLAAGRLTETNDIIIAILMLR